MITEDLITYIQKQRRKNVSDTLITSRLTKAGWHVGDILEGFRKITPPKPVFRTEKPIILPSTTSNPTVKPLPIVEVPKSITKPLVQPEIKESPIISVQPPKFLTPEEIKLPPKEPQTVLMQPEELLPHEELEFLPKLVKPLPIVEVPKSITKPLVQPEIKESPIISVQPPKFLTPEEIKLPPKEPQTVLMQPEELLPHEELEFLPKLVKPLPIVEVPKSITKPLVQPEIKESPIISVQPPKFLTPEEIKLPPKEPQTVLMQPEELLPHEELEFLPKLVKPLPINVTTSVFIPTKKITPRPIVPTTPITPLTPIIPITQTINLSPITEKKELININLIKKDQVLNVPAKSVEKISQDIKPKIEPLVNNIAASAIITTFALDSLAAKQAKEEESIKSLAKKIPLKPKGTSSQVPIRKNNKKAIFIIILIVILSTIAGVAFALRGGYISLPSFSFIKKDPRILLLKSPMLLKSFDSYRSQTVATVSFPSFANITNGLISGNRVNSEYKDSISFNINSTIHPRGNNAMLPLQASVINIKSSQLKDDIKSEFKYDGNTSYLTLPQLKMLIGEDAPPAELISLDKNNLEGLLFLLPNEAREIISNADKNKILSTGIPEEIKKDIASVFKEFINKADLIEKPEEDINGHPTYHYQIVSDRQELKKLLVSLLDISGVALPEKEKENVIEAFGSTNLETFEIWIGKKDSIIHQYKFVLTVPLSKVINLDDKGIAGNEVKIEWLTSYDNFNTPNPVSIPTDAIPVSDFVKSIADIKIKNTLLLLKSSISSLRNAQGLYGKQSNNSGSCTNPTPGSLFSPVGHTTASSNAVGGIASHMNTLFNLTNGIGSCFSSSGSWAASFPLASDPLSSYCLDSKSTLIILTTPLEGVTCK